MRILALETDIDKIKKQFCHDNEGEREVLFTYYHGLSFFFAIIREILLTIFTVILAVVGLTFNWPLWAFFIMFLLWFLFVVYNVIRAYIDWAYDFIFVTTDKVILVDQTSFFKQEIKPIHLENIGGVSTETQFWNIMPFGIIRISLKEGEGGGEITKKYVPRAEEVASRISDVVTHYQRHYG